MKLVIGSVYHENWGWYAVQQKFLKLTTDNYEFFIVSKDKPPFECNWVKKKKGNQNICRDHVEGIKAIYEQFNASDADYCLLMDSDAFPVKKYWTEILTEQIKNFDKKYAAPIRMENGDTFPHVSFLFFNKKYIDVLMPRLCDIDKTGFNFLGNNRLDVGTNLPKDTVFPLLKSNKYSPNPCFHTIYYDMVYHCGCGSRSINMEFLDYWKTIRPKDFNFEVDSKFISTINEHFINRLLQCERFNRFL